MKLSLEQIKSTVKGAAETVLCDNKIELYRLTREQSEVYLSNKEFYEKSFASAGVRLEFITSSKELALCLGVRHADKLTWYRHDIYVNGSHALKIEGDLKDCPDRQKKITERLSLGDGDKHICIYLSWTAATDIISLELDDGATFAPVPNKYRAIMFGDSITHGACASDSSALYPVRVGAALDCEAIDKGIGGDYMRPELAAVPDSFTPDFITVAYGTNDWGHKPADVFAANCHAFFKNLRNIYPDTKIFALAPIWRGTADTQVKEMGDFGCLARIISEQVSTICNVTFINCIDFVPHSPEMFSPDMLHPSDLGFEHYAKNLAAELIKHL